MLQLKNSDTYIIKENFKNKIISYAIKKEFYNNLRKIEKYKEIQKLESLYFQHGTTTVYKHSRNVAYACIYLAKKLEKNLHIQFNYQNLLIGAFLHDLFLYDWHEKDATHRLHGYTHPATASRNAKEMCHVNEEVIKIIKSHMWPLTITKVPKSREAILVCLVDKVVAFKETIKFIRFFNRIKVALIESL